MKNQTNSTNDFADTMRQEVADRIREELGFHARSARKRYEDAQAKLLADIQINPASAITWSAESMVKAQTDHEVWLNIEREMAEHDPREVLKANLEEVRYRVRSFFGSNSTSIFSNAVERARAEAFLRQTEELEGLARHYGL